MVYVPAFNVLYTSMDALVGHHRRYRSSELVTLLERAGFVISKKAYTDVLGFFVTLATFTSTPVSTSQAIVGGVAGVGIGIVGAQASFFKLAVLVFLA